jgi:hypothetical protein
MLVLSNLKLLFPDLHHSSIDRLAGWFIIAVTLHRAWWWCSSSRLFLHLVPGAAVAEYCELLGELQLLLSIFWPQNLYNSPICTKLGTIFSEITCYVALRLYWFQ